MTGTTPRGETACPPIPRYPQVVAPLVFIAGQHAQGAGGRGTHETPRGNACDPWFCFRGFPPPVGPRVLRLSPFRCAEGAAPPLGRGPLFTSQGRHRIRRRDGHGAPAWAGASLCFPKVLPESTSGWTRRPRMRGGLFSLPQVAICVDFGEGMATRDVAPGKPQGFSPQRLSRHAAPRLRTR